VEEKALKSEDRRPRQVEIDPFAVMRKTSCYGKVDRNAGTVELDSVRCLRLVASYFGLEIASDAVGFYSHGWVWKVAGEGAE